MACCPRSFKVAAQRLGLSLESRIQERSSPVHHIFGRGLEQGEAQLADFGGEVRLLDRGDADGYGHGRLDGRAGQLAVTLRTESGVRNRLAYFGPCLTEESGHSMKPETPTVNPSIGRKVGPSRDVLEVAGLTGVRGVRMRFGECSDPETIRVCLCCFSFCFPPVIPQFTQPLQGRFPRGNKREDPIPKRSRPRKRRLTKMKLGTT